MADFKPILNRALQRKNGEQGLEVWVSEPSTRTDLFSIKSASEKWKEVSAHNKDRPRVTLQRLSVMNSLTQTNERR